MSADPADGRPAPPCAIVLFGAAGDLAKRKILPSLSHLRGRGLLPDAFTLVGVARAPMPDAAYGDKVAGDVTTFSPKGATTPADTAWLASRARFVGGDFGDPALYAALARRLDELPEAAGRYLFYLATPPAAFAEVARGLSAAGLLRQEDGRWRRVVVEKPFGRDLASARALNRELLGLLAEDQLYRIDHYLGKETVQNLIALRFGNGVFEPVWNRNFIDHVQITVAETLGVERRAGYYEQAGALRDMVPNHLFQLLALTAMDPPASFSATAVRNEMCEVIDAVAPLAPEDVPRRVVRGQYAGDGERAIGYRGEPGVAPASTTETYVALELELDNWRWAGVPFYLRTGKRLERRVSEIVVSFRRAPATLFRHQGQTPPPNELVVRLSPDEGVRLEIQARVPGPRIRLGAVPLRFSYEDAFGASPSTGYETLLLDALLGEATLFQRADMVEAGWRVVQPIQQGWAEAPAGPEPYAAGSWGPRAADELLARTGRAWRTPF